MTPLENLVVAANGGKVKGAQTRLAELLGISQATVSRWCKGKSVPERDVHARLAGALGISVAQLEAVLASKSPAPSGVDMSSAIYGVPLAPVLGVVCADRFSVAYDAPPEDRIPNPYPDEKDVYSLRIKGDCMEPSLHDGEHTFILPHRRPVDKDVVLALLDGEYTLKRYRVLNGVAWLVPENKKYDRIKVTKHVIIKGVAKGAYRKDI